MSRPHGVRGTAGPQLQRGLAQGHPEGHGQGSRLPTWGLSGLAPAGGTALGVPWGRGTPDTSLLGSSGEPRISALASAEPNGAVRLGQSEWDRMDGVGWDVPSCHAKQGGRGSTMPGVPHSSCPSPHSNYLLLRKRLIVLAI